MSHEIPACPKHHYLMERDANGNWWCPLPDCAEATKSDGLELARDAACAAMQGLCKPGVSSAELQRELALYLGIDVEECHIDSFPIGLCQKVHDFVGLFSPEVTGMGLANIRTGKQKRPRRTVVYGTHGIGKSTWASRWPSPVFIPTEDGCGDLDVASYPLCETLAETWNAITELGDHVARDHDFKTAILDSADWLERQIHTEVCDKAGKDAITDFEYGKGFGSSTTIFDNVLSSLSLLRGRGMHIVIIAHCEIRKVTEPGLDSYDRYTPKLHKDISSLLQEWADEVLFFGYERFVRKEDMGFKKTRGIATGGDERVIHTQESAGYLAKNRLGLPAKMSMDDFDAYMQFVG